MYELFILGELMDQPLHGYLLREIINLAIGPLRQMSWGALYPLLRRLEADGLIEQTEEPPGGDRPRKVYRITPAGRDRFKFLMLAPDEHGADYFEAFNTQLMNFDHLTPAQQRQLVAAYREFVQFVQRQTIKATSFAASEQHIPEPERAWILRVQDHRLHLLAADLQWIEALEGQLGTSRQE